MARALSFYSRVVVGLKILLPLAALALLSTLFLFSRSREPLQSLPFAATETADGVAQQGASKPYYTGVTSDGNPLIMTADRAWPKGEGVVRAETMTVRMMRDGGGEIRLNAVNAVLQNADRTIHMDGGVRITSTDGYTLRTEAMVSSLDETRAESLAPVTGEGPMGTLAADRMQITPDPGAGAEAGAVQIVFTGSVKTVYLPQQEEVNE